MRCPLKHSNNANVLLFVDCVRRRASCDLFVPISCRRIDTQKRRKWLRCLMGVEAELFRNSTRNRTSTNNNNQRQQNITTVITQTKILQTDLCTSLCCSSDRKLTISTTKTKTKQTNYFIYLLTTNNQQLTINNNQQSIYLFIKLLKKRS